jgi:hypothetical protein
LRPEAIKFTYEYNLCTTPSVGLADCSQQVSFWSSPTGGGHAD